MNAFAGKSSLVENPESHLLLFPHINLDFETFEQDAYQALLAKACD